MKKIILVNQVAGPMFIDIANHYQSKNYEVVLATGKIEQTGKSLHPAVYIVKLARYRRNNPVLRITTWLLFFVQAWFYLKREKSEAKILLVSNSPFVPLIAHYLRRRTKLKWEILIYDIYPDVLERFGILSEKSIISKWWRKTNQKSYEQAENLYTISEGMKEVLIQYAPAMRWRVVYPWVDTSFIKPLSKGKNPFVKKYNLQNKTVILYSGNMGATHNLMPILKAAEALQNRTDYFFLMIGDGSEKRKLLNYAEKHKLKNILFLPFQKPEVLPWSLTAADIGIVTLSGAAAQMSVPSKTFYQMAAGNALLCIAERNSELAKIVTENNCGFVLPSNVSNQITKCLLNLEKSKLCEYRKYSRIASTKFSIKNIRNFQ